MAERTCEEGGDVRSWPPGTVRLEQATGSSIEHVLLHPVPTNDPNDPLNWSKIRKAVNFALVCYYTLMVFVLVDIGTVIYGQLNAELGFSFEELNQSFALSTTGLALGCILFIPFALKFGRRPIYLLSIIICFGAAIWLAKVKTVGDLYGANIVSGLAGSISETICQMTIADLFFTHQRGTMNGIYLLVVAVGSFLSLVPAGYSADSQGWPWIWWWTSILLAVALVLFTFFYEETKYLPFVDAEASELPTAGDPQEIKKNPASRYTLEAVSTIASKTVSSEIPLKSYRQRMTLYTATPGSIWTIARHTYQPFMILFTFPGVAYTALMYGSLLAWFSLVLSTLSIYFTLPPYEFSPSAIGLLNIAPFIGSILGSIYGGPLSDWSIVQLAKRNNGIYEPEMRLWLALPAVLLTPAGMFMFGFSLAEGKHWIIPSIGSAIFGFGFTVLGDISLTYLIDSYKDIVGDSLVAVAFVRNAFATIIAMTLTPWIDGMGLYNVFLLAGCVALLLFLSTIPMLIWGRKFRAMTAERYAVMAARQFDTRGLTISS